jgi:hypothetical protein
MTKWKYKIAQDSDLGSLQAKVNKLGKIGWEAISSGGAGGGGHSGVFFVLMKKPL